MSGQIDVSSAKEFLVGYLAEVEEHLGSVSKNLLAVEDALGRSEPSPRAIRELFRSLHTIKGLSAMVGFDPVVDIAHGMEAVLRTADQAGGRIGAGALDVMLKGVAAIEVRVRALADGKAVPAAPAALIEALGALEPHQGPAPAAVQSLECLAPALVAKASESEREQLLQGVRHGQRALQVTFVPSSARVAEGLSITTVRQRIAAIADIVKVVPIAFPETVDSPGGVAFVLMLLTTEPDDRIAEAAAARADSVLPLFGPKLAAPRAATPPVIDEAAETPMTEAASRGTIRVAVSRLDDALEKLAAVVVTRFRLGRAVADLKARGADVRALEEILQENTRQIRDLRGSIMRARMISVADMLERVPLIVRGLSRTTGKPVRVEIDAGRAELDKAVAERLFPAVIHLIRNAVDHAIEPAEERRRLGKPREGRISVTCFERSNNQLELVVSDDGAGIDREAVARRADRKVPATDDGLLALLVLPGVSTRDEVTTTSGRGVGMEIVQRVAVDELGGELLLRTERGSGTAFTLRVPLTITIIDAFSFTCQDHRFVVPVASVEEIVDVTESTVVAAPAPGDRDAPVSLMKRRGEALPLVRLGDLFRLSPSSSSSPAPKAIVVRRNGEPFAFAVDRMLGRQEVVVRPLSDPLVRVPGVSGSTDLGDGCATLVLDLVALSARLSPSQEVSS